MSEAWFHKSLRGGTYHAGGCTFIVGSDGLLVATGPVDEDRLGGNANVEKRHLTPPPAPPPPVPPSPMPTSTPTVQADTAEKQSGWFHHTLQGGTYSIGGHTFLVAASGLLVPPPAADLLPRLQANSNLTFREIGPGEAPTAAELGSLVSHTQVASSRGSAPEAAEGTLDSDMGDDISQALKADAVSKAEVAAALAAADAKPAEPEAPVEQPPPAGESEPAASSALAEPEVAPAPSKKTGFGSGRGSHFRK